MDVVLSSMVERFATIHDLTNADPAVIFEHFTNFCVLSREHPERFKLESVHVGGAGDLHMDGLAILVNDHLVTRIADVDELKQRLRRWEVTFIFIQAKRSSSFDTGDILKFLAGVRTFFRDTHPPGINERIGELMAVREYIYKHSASMPSNPICRMFYAATGEWDDSKHAAAATAIAQTKADLLNTKLFGGVEFTALDGDQLQQLYRALTLRIERQIVFEKHTPLPKIAGVEQAYIGILPCTEYLKLIVDDKGALDKRRFYDNVRDYLGDSNPVNSQIKNTLGAPGTNDRFVLFNNGVTVVAKEVRQTGTDLTLIDYQVVNGCQTSHVLYRSKDKLSRNSYLPVKVIVTKDLALTEQIIEGTNKQSELRAWAFAALQPFQRRLEEFYEAMRKSGAVRLHYERRSNQYDDTEVTADQIVSIDEQARAFVAMFLNEPHHAIRLAPALVEGYRTKLFLEEAHSLWPYYVCGLASYWVGRLLRRGVLEKRYESFRYHVVMLMRLLDEKEPVPPLNRHVLVEKYCGGLRDTLSDESKVGELARKCAGILGAALKKAGMDMSAAVQVPEFTETLKAMAKNGGTEAAAVGLEKGRVRWFDSALGYGFITDDAEQDRFVHYTDIVGPRYAFRSLVEGEEVEFIGIDTPRGARAIEVRRAEP
jgi:cold shock CspA family protein